MSLTCCVVWHVGLEASLCVVMSSWVLNAGDHCTQSNKHTNNISTVYSLDFYIVDEFSARDTVFFVAQANNSVHFHFLLSETNRKLKT